jgi:eukaryotic-like serine/threonine-protein kinase
MSANNNEYVPSLSQTQVEQLAGLVRDALEPESTTFAVDNLPELNDLEGKSFGRFQSLELVGYGGFGSVYRAFDPRHNRRIALKIPYRRIALDATMVRRFQIEAEAAAKLDHPGIVPLYEVGTVDSRPYIASAYAPGLNLSQWRKRLSSQGRNFEPRAAAFVAKAVARAMEVAHSHGVIHRDLKPSNIILQPAAGSADVEIDGVSYWVRIIDFGLAKLGEGVSDLTRTDIHLGTPHFMAPEQFTRRFGSISLLTDVYGLGATLYTVLAGREPFAGEEQLDLFGRILVDSPEPPSTLRPEVPGDLSAICRRCLEKAPTDRFGSMRELADDLERFLHGRRVKADGSWISKAVRGVRRRSTLTKALVLAIAISAGGFGVAQLQRVHREKAAEVERSRTLAQEKRELDYLAAVQEAFANFDACNMTEVENFLSRFADAKDLQDIEWRLLKRLANADAWRVQTDSPEVHSTAISPDPANPVVFCGLSDGRVQMRSKANGQLLLTLHRHSQSVNWMEFLDGGKTLLTCGEDGFVRSWDARTGKMLHEFKAHDDWIAVGRLTPDGRFFVTCGGDKSIRLWALPSFKPAGSLNAHTDTVRDVSVSADGKYLISCGEDRLQLLWDLQSRSLAAKLPHCSGGSYPSRRWARHIHFVGAGPPYRATACFFNGQVVVYQFTSPQKVVVEREMSFRAQRSALRARDNRLFMTRWDGAIVAAEPANDTTEAEIVLRGHLGRPFAISLDATGSFLATGDRKGQVRLWPLDKDPLGWCNEEVESHGGFLDDDHIYLTGAKGKVSVHHASDGRLVHAHQFSQEALGPPKRLGAAVWQIAGNNWWGLGPTPGPALQFKSRPGFDPGAADGGRFVPSWDGVGRRIVVHSPDFEGVTAVVEGITTAPGTLRVSQDGRLLVGRFDKELKFFRLTPTVEEIPLDALDTRAEAVNYSFSPGGDYLILVKDDRSITVWATATGEQLSSVCGRRSLQNAVVTSDGQRIIAVDAQGRLYIWDLRRQAFIGSFLLGSDVRAADLELSPVGDRLLVFLAVGRQSYNRIRMINLNGR